MLGVDLNSIRVINGGCWHHWLWTNQLAAGFGPGTKAGKARPEQDLRLNSGLALSGWTD